MNKTHCAGRRQWLRGLAGMAVAGMLPMACPRGAEARPLRRGDRLLVAPALARWLDDGRVAVRLQAWAFERERNPTRTRLLAKALGLDLDELPAEQRQLFEQRSALFGADAKPGRHLHLVVDGHPPRPLPPTDDGGRLQAWLTLPWRDAWGEWLDLALVSGAHRVPARAQLIAQQGLSVVSDIDDTVKHTQVRDRRQMLLNTFARPFAAVPGMAAWYARIAAAEAGVSFHYVSGSPWQLLPPLLDFVAAAGLPAGSLHPRVLPLRPEALLDHEATVRHKNAEITQLLQHWPQRRFLLVGDSGERDPETYGALMRAHPDRIVAALIRDVTGEPATDLRYVRAFEGVASERWKLFEDPSSMAARWP